MVAAFFLVQLYLVIFFFSGQNAEESGSVSRLVSEKCVELYGTISGKDWTGQLVKELASCFEHPLRKLAHFAEYAYMGVLVYLMWSPWIERRKKRCLTVLVWVFLSAAADEIHQLFVQGRYGSMSDVLLDTCGGLAGIILCVAVTKAAGVLRLRSEHNDDCKEEKMKNRNFWESLKCAFRGLAKGYAAERNFKIYTVIAVAFLILNGLAGAGSVEYVLFVMLAASVFAAEYFNTAIERAIDRLGRGVNEDFRFAKDVAAAAVLVCGMAFFAGEGILLWRAFFHG